MIAIIDYGAGNIRSVEKALMHIGCEVEVTQDPSILMKADGAVLPGVGSFGDAMHELRGRELEAPIKAFVASGKPFLGICLGLQILFESSEESPGVSGLSLLKGKVLRIPAAPGLKIPHIGWNSLEIKKDGGLFRSITGEPYVYFVHSYYLKAEEDVVTATAQYGVEIHAAVQKNNLMAMSISPGKKRSVGTEAARKLRRHDAGKGGRVNVRQTHYPVP